MRRRNTFGRSAMSTFGRNARRFFGRSSASIEEPNPEPPRRRRRPQPERVSVPSEDDPPPVRRAYPMVQTHRINYAAIASRVRVPEVQRFDLPRQSLLGRVRRYHSLIAEAEASLVRLEQGLAEQETDSGDEPKELVEGTLCDYVFRGDEEHNQCTICLTNFCVGEVIGQLPCRHIFHIDCIGEWVFKHPTCPICRMKLATI